MKIRLDTENKTIKIDSNVKLKDLVETLEKLLPKGLWKEFKLESNVTINNWQAPLIIKEIEREVVPVRPVYPWYCGDGYTTTTCQLQSGVYNVEC